MAGFGAAKEAKEAKEAVPFTPLKQKKNKTSNNPKEGQSNFVEKAYDASNDPFADLRNELQSLHKKSPKSTLFGLIAGHENTGKTAIVLDAYDKVKTGFVDPQHAKQVVGDLWILDFDGGGAASAAAFYKNSTSIRCWDPWVMQKGDRTAYDYPATHDRVMKIMQFAVDIARKQEEENYDGDRLWGVIVTGIDLWDSICINNMRIIDLNLASDGIEAADWNVKVGHQWDWAIRKTRFHQLTALSRGLVSAGVNVFWETHLRMTNYSFGKNEEAAKWRPDCEKATNNYVYQILICERTDTYDDERKGVIRSEFSVTFEKSKTNADLQGQKRTILVTEAGKPARWIGLPELSDGSL